MRSLSFHTTKYIILLVILVPLLGCQHLNSKDKTIELISDSRWKENVFNSLTKITNNVIDNKLLDDSLAFLVLPIHASCPYCRNKTIDSIAKYQEKLPKNHFIIIAANGGRKLINSYFRNKNLNLPEIKHVLFLDTTNQSWNYDLYEDKPTFYYTYNRHAYKKVSSIPETIKEDLHQFFSGKNHNLPTFARSK
jgi:hypothetical protein